MTVFEQFARRSGLVALAVIGAVACVAPMSGCEKHDAKAQAAPPPPVEVTVARPLERDVVEYITYTGTIAASETVDLRARVAGFLEKVGSRCSENTRSAELASEASRGLRSLAQGLREHIARFRV